MQKATKKFKFQRMDINNKFATPCDSNNNHHHNHNNSDDDNKF